MMLKFTVKDLIEDNVVLVPNFSSNDIKDEQNGMQLYLNSKFIDVVNWLENFNL